MVPIRYVASATLARTADAGAGVGLVLLAADHGSGPAIGGVLAASLTFPHLAGPLPARLLDRSRDGRGILAGFFAVYGMALAIATLTFGSVPLPVTLALVIVSGLCGPILTGGLSSRLASLVSPEGLRRAQGADAVTYGVGGSAGPAVVAGLAAVTSPVAALLVLSGAAMTSALLVLGLPSTAKRQEAAAPSSPFRQVLATIARVPGLRRATIATVAVQLVGGTLVVLSVGLSQRLGAGAHGGAVLIAVFGIGNLVGSLAVTARPLRGSADVWLSGLSVLIAVLIIFAGLAPAYWVALLAFALAGFVTGPHFTATLSARSDYAPPGNTAQVFVTMSALKIGMQSLGTAAAGFFGTGGARPGMIGGGLLIVVVMGILSLDRMRHPATVAHA